MPWWHPQAHADRRPLLLLRGRIKAQLSAYFMAQGFTEVECAILQISPGNEAHLHAFATEAQGPDGSRQPLYLHTSPEFSAKKLLSAGEEKIFEFARVFRNRERGRLHAPEFTMLEWYRAHTEDSGADYRAVIADGLALLKLAAQEAGKPLTYLDRGCDPQAQAEWLTVADAFRIHAGVELLDTLSPEGVGNRDMLATRAKRAGFSIADDDGWSDIFSKLLATRVEPRLGLGKPTVLYDYPRAEAALARPKPDDPRLAERFELYACGVELANGFGD